MDDWTPPRRSRLGLSDPVRARRPANIIGLSLAIVSAVSLAFFDGGVQALALGISWLLLIPTALLLGWATAFFVEHGVGVRRAVAELCVGVLAALGACVTLSVRDGGGAGTIVTLLAGFVLYGAVFRALASGLALGIGRGGQYLGQRIQHVDDDGW